MQSVSSFPDLNEYVSLWLKIWIEEDQLYVLFTVKLEYNFE